MDTSSMEPMLPDDREDALADRALRLVAKASALGGRLHGRVQDAIDELVRSMNCYYSNLIEGHNTHPRDIDRALADDYARESPRRELQLEARAHIELQRMIDAGDDPEAAPASAEYLRWLHREFCRRLPEQMLWVQDPDTRERIRVVPGELRTGGVQVDRHAPPAASDLPRFLARFEEAYAPDRLSRVRRIVAAAAAHHRLLWIHPFYDGNGRVARLMSHAMLLRCGVGSSIWSVARGLARSVDRYKAALMRTDEPRHGDLDGRGELSEERLREFCVYFLEICVGQVEFMNSLLQPSELLRRMKLYVDDEVAAGRLPRGSMALLREAFIAGEVERGRAPELTGYRERRGRQILSKLLEKGLLVSQGPRAPARLGIPIDVVERWFPALYPVG